MSDGVRIEKLRLCLPGRKGAWWDTNLLPLGMSSTSHPHPHSQEPRATGKGRGMNTWSKTNHTISWECRSVYIDGLSKIRGTSRLLVGAILIISVLGATGASSSYRWVSSSLLLCPFILTEKQWPSLSVAGMWTDRSADGEDGTQQSYKGQAGVTLLGQDSREKQSWWRAGDGGAA